MLIPGRLGLEAFADVHPQIEAQVSARISEVAAAKWKDTHELKARYPRASVLGKGRVIFDLGRKLRVDTLVDFLSGVVRIQRFDFHDKYERWD